MTPRPDTESQRSLFKDGKIDPLEMRSVMQVLGQRLKAVLDALQRVMALSEQPGVRLPVSRMAFSVGIEIGSLLRDIPHFRDSLLAIDDQAARMAAASVNLYMSPLQEAASAFALQPLGGVKEAESAEAGGAE